MTANGPVDPTQPSAASDDSPPAPPPARPGASIFTIEGRAAPALFVIGWLATLLGLGIVIVGALAPSAVFVYFVGPTILAIGLIAGAGNQAIERRARGWAYAGPSPYLVFAAMIAAIYAVGYPLGFLLKLALGTTEIADYVVRLIGVALQAVVFFGVIRLTVVGTNALSWREMGWRRFDRQALGDVGVGVAFAMPIIGLTSVLAYALVTIFGVVPEAPLPATGVLAGVIVQLIAGAVVAPIAEETVFRGFAISAWRRTVGENGALLRASFLFALAHVLTVSGDNLPQVGALIVVGFATRLPVALALGWLFLRRGSIWAPIGLHIAFNGILLILGELATRASTPVG
jgi:membrane protease YdiL (CAAX protease family)